MLFINVTVVIVDITISCRSFVFSQSRAKVSDGLTDMVSGLPVTAFDLGYWKAFVIILVSQVIFSVFVNTEELKTSWYCECRFPTQRKRLKLILYFFRFCPWHCVLNWP